MSRQIMILIILLVTLAALPGCIIHPGYYPDDRGYYYESYPLFYGPYLYAPFSLWYGGNHHGNFGRGHGFHGGGRR